MVPEDEEMNENEDYELLFGSKQPEEEEDSEAVKKIKKMGFSD